MFKYCFIIYFAYLQEPLVTMQDAVNEINKLNRVLSHPVHLDPKSERGLQVIVCTRTLGVGFHPQTRRKIK